MNNLKYRNFKPEDHEESLKLQLGLNMASEVVETNLEKFEEEEIQTYEEQNKILVSYVDLEALRPYSDEYEAIGTKECTRNIQARVFRR